VVSFVLNALDLLLLLTFILIAIKSESTSKRFKVNRHQLKSFLNNPSLLDTVVEEISLLDPTSLPSSAMTYGVFFPSPSLLLLHVSNHIGDLIVMNFCLQHIRTLCTLSVGGD